MSEDVERLRQRLDQIQAKLLAYDTVLLGLIATHPNPERLLRQLSIYSLALEGDFLANASFPDRAREHAKEAIGRWIGCIEDRIQHESKSGPK